MEPSAITSAVRRPAELRFSRKAIGWMLDVAFVLAAGGLCCAYLAGRPLNHDVAWYLVSGERWLRGATLYRDIIEVNPPLAYFEVAAVLKLPVPPKLAYLLAMQVLIVASCLWVRRLAARDSQVSPHIAVLSSTAALLVVPLGDFGQREQVALAATLPYLWASASKTRLSKPESIALGIFGFLGLGLKPYFLAIPAGACAVEMFRERSLWPLLAPANVTVAALCLVYTGLILIIFPDYLGSVVPMARLTYFAYGLPPVLVLTQPVLLTALPLIVIGLRTPGSAGVWSGALAGAVCCYLVQFKGWSYHQIPIGGLMLVTSAVLLAVRKAGEPGRRPATLVALLAAFTALVHGAQGSYRPEPTYYELKPYFANTRSALILGENVWLAFPLVEELHVQHASRYSAMWPLPGATIIATTESGARAAAARLILDKTRAIVVGDFVRARPEVLVVDVRKFKPYFRGPFDYLRFLDGDRRFGPAFAEYKKAGHIGWLDIYRRRN